MIGTRGECELEDDVKWSSSCVEFVESAWGS